MRSQRSGDRKAKTQGHDIHRQDSGKRLYSVSCGIESVVIGEDEILGQVRRAYDLSRERIGLSSEVNMIFQGLSLVRRK